MGRLWTLVSHVNAHHRDFIVGESLSNEVDQTTPPTQPYSPEAPHPRTAPTPGLLNGHMEEWSWW